MIKHIHWGWRIAILYFGFTAMILTLVYLSSQEKVELVTNDYYQKEMAFQGIIDANKNSIIEQMHAHFEVFDHQLSIQFPTTTEGLEKQIYVYHVSESAKDQNIITKEPQLFIALSKGKYTIQLSWQLNGKKYFEEKTVHITE
jgi:hypothetical protein